MTREVKYFTQADQDSNEPNWDPNPGSMAPKATALTATPSPHSIVTLPLQT